MNATPSPFPATPLFPSLHGKGTGGRDGLSTQFFVIQKEAEVPAEIRKIMSGHNTAATHAGYTPLEIGTLTSAVAKLPDLPASFKRR